MTSFTVPSPPTATSGNGKLVWETLEKILDEEQIEYRVFFTAYRYHATRLAADITAAGIRLTLVEKSSNYRRRACGHHRCVRIVKAVQGV